MYFITLTEYKTGKELLIRIDNIDHMSPYIALDKDVKDYVARDDVYWLVLKEEIFCSWDQKQMMAEEIAIKESPQQVQAKIESCVRRVNAVNTRRRSPKPSI